MKKQIEQNKKIAYSVNKVFRDLARRHRLFLTILCALAIGVFAGMAITNDNISFDDVKKPIFVATLLGGIGSIQKATDVQKRGRKIKRKIWLLSADQWDDTQGFPARVGRTVANIPLKAGEFWHYMEMVQDGGDYKSVGESGDVTATITSTFTAIVGGMGDALLNLLEQGINEDFFVVVEFCDTGEKFLLGDGCKPTMLKSFDGGSTNDNTSWTIVFEKINQLIWSDYTGNTPEQAADVVAADAVTIALTSNSRYQLTDGTVATVTLTGFTAVTDADIGRIVTILGSGGDWPSDIDDQNDFLLEGGVTWDAVTGSQISFYIFKDGAAQYKFVEIAGSRI